MQCHSKTPQHFAWFVWVYIWFVTISTCMYWYISTVDGYKYQHGIYVHLMMIWLVTHYFALPMLNKFLCLANIHIAPRLGFKLTIGELGCPDRDLQRPMIMAVPSDLGVLASNVDAWTGNGSCLVPNIKENQRSIADFWKSSQLCTWPMEKSTKIGLSVLIGLNGV